MNVIDLAFYYEYNSDFPFWNNYFWGQYEDNLEEFYQSIADLGDDNEYK